MGDIRNQLRFHPLALDFLLHRFLESVLNLLQILFHRIVNSKITFDFHVQISCRQLIRRFLQEHIFPADIIKIFAQEQKQ